MDKLAKIRLENMIAIVNNTFNGNWTAFAKAIQKSRSYMSDIKNGHKSQFTEKLAHHIETKLALPLGYLDKSDAKPEVSVTMIPLYPSKPPAGNNNLQKKNQIGEIPFSLSEIQKANIKKENLISLVVESNSMQYTINEGSIAIVDMSQKEVIDNKIYAFTTNKQQIIQVKRLRTGTDSVILQPDNKKFAEEKIPHNSKTKLEIIGRVLWVINKLV
ncbi:MAG: hypothetical protein K0R14_781 [Burkholderiales bacterium]|jgi:SOS-response transcriptional repressor LexA|nr:hypothetical protein [Burkholderiales bacterium]